MTNLPKTEKLILDLNKGWLTIWFNSPENRNALSSQLTTELVAVLNAVKDDRSVRGITMRGKGGIFCAGGDLKSFSASQSGGATHEAMAVMNREAGDMFDLIMGMPQVVIALVEGAAIAGGLGLMCCADIVAVTKDAKFALTETMIGIPPAQIAPIIVGRVGLPKARRLMLTGARFTGAVTPEYDLSDFVVDDVQGLETVEAQIIKGVMKCAPGAIGATKEILMATPHLDREAQKRFAADKFATAILSDEGKEGILSFIEKRKPDWAQD
jgi:isohexenylglutaconyl-CoA hydratase